jgi:hypothetical protein
MGGVELSRRAGGGTLAEAAVSGRGGGTRGSVDGGGIVERGGRSAAGGSGGGTIDARLGEGVFTVPAEAGSIFRTITLRRGGAPVEPLDMDYPAKCGVNLAVKVVCHKPSPRELLASPSRPRRRVLGPFSSQRRAGAFEEESR